MSDYGIASRVLHGLALGANAVGEATFDIERIFHGKGVLHVEEGKHVFVAGLARSGTTVLMRSLYDSDAFCSLTYRDMPFVLAPNMWAAMSKADAKSMRATDRAHGDGVLVDYDSPAALEEVFWRVFSGSRYVRRDHLAPMESSLEDVSRFRTYIAMILKRYAAERYLSKNNNNILRLTTITAACPRSLILVPYRTPVQQAYSLLKQHQRFCQLHESDPFSAKYMKWLVHHEFGSDHRPFLWGIGPAEERDPFTMEYWLAQWIGVYEYLLEQLLRLGEPVIPLCYELVCGETERVWPLLSARLELGDALPPTLDLRERDAPKSVDAELLVRADEIYDALYAESRRRLCL